MLRIATHLIAAVVLFGSVSVAPAAVTTIDTCGQTLSGLGVLTQDLDCGGSGLGVLIDLTGKLDLAGFTIANAGTGIFCVRGCTVFSSGTPGVIRDSANNGISSNGRKVTIENIMVTGSGGFGVRQSAPPIGRWRNL
jgi:hypothetical protein